MTGKDLIIYILRNNLENEIVFKDGIFIGFMSEEEAANKFKVGINTIRVWYSLGMLNGFKIGDTIFFFKDMTDPRKDMI